MDRLLLFVTLHKVAATTISKFRPIALKSLFLKTILILIKKGVERTASDSCVFEIKIWFTTENIQLPLMRLFNLVVLLFIAAANVIVNQIMNHSLNFQECFRGNRIGSQKCLNLTTY